jgi:probable F420-dependent oxidoreductase
MKFGLFGINMNICSNPDVAAQVAQAAEAAGFESVWTGEHVVLPDPQAPPSPLPPLSPLLDPAIALAFIAAHTKKVKLGTGIISLPQRNPLVLAKELASVDVVSNGRLIFGLGIGYLKAEFDALGAPFEQKGPRSMDYVQAMKAVWTQDKPTYTGQFVSFKDIQARPQPVQKPHPPIVIGGHTKEAFRRAVQYGNGWYGFALDVGNGKSVSLDSGGGCTGEPARRTGRARDQHYTRTSARPRSAKTVRRSRCSPLDPLPPSKDRTGIT